MWLPLILFFCSDNNIETYVNAKTKQAKTDIVNNVYESIRASSPNGGFIRKVRQKRVHFDTFEVRHVDYKN